MTDVTTPRRCGNCGGTVGIADIICPHCDALLAAYEAPAGAVAGTTAAVTPVDASTPPAAPATYTAPTPVQPPASPSPVATAVATTLAAAEEHEPDPADAGDDVWPLSSAPVSTTLAEPVDPDTLPDAPSPNLPTPTPSLVPSPVREALAETKAAAATPPIAQGPRPEPRPTPPPARPTPEPVEAQPIPASAQRIHEQRREQWTTKAPEKRAKTKSDGVSLVVIIFTIIIFMRVAGSNSFFGTVLTLGVVAFIIWFVMRLANATGRKTTSMPRDDWRPKR